MATVPTGTVNVNVDGQSVGSATLDANGNASVTGTVTLGSGSHSVDVAYSGDSNYNPANGATSFNIPSTGGKDGSIVTVQASYANGTVSISINVAGA